MAGTPPRQEEEEEGGGGGSEDMDLIDVRVGLRFLVAVEILGGLAFSGFRV